MELDVSKSKETLAFYLVYVTFFLDNVLLTVLVPIIPDWVGSPMTAPWIKQTTQIIATNNITMNPTEAFVSEENGGGLAGLVLGSKAGAQLLMAPIAGAFVSRRGPVIILTVGALVLALTSLGLSICCLSNSQLVVFPGALLRAAHGAGSALASVAGLALVQRIDSYSINALLPSVALGVLVGYPFGGAASEWSRAAPFVIVAAAFSIIFALQILYLNDEEYNEPSITLKQGSIFSCVRSACEQARSESTGVCSGALLLATSVLAALEPCLPLWLSRHNHAKHWQLGAAFVPDSAGYLLSTGVLAARARSHSLSAERIAIPAQLCVGVSSCLVGLASSPISLVVPQFAVGAGIGALDAALVPALLARAGRHVPHRAALLQAASGAAAAMGPVVGGVVASNFGFSAALHLFGVVNILYTFILYKSLKRFPLTAEWGATTPNESDEEDGSCTAVHLTEYTRLTELQ